MVVLASNSEHLKPNFAILQHTLVGFRLGGVKSRKFGELGNIKAIFREINEPHGKQEDDGFSDVFYGEVGSSRDKLTSYG